ncbi:efflux transporter outer membrane subunit [Methylomonas sp. MgM2]
MRFISLSAYAGIIVLFILSVSGCAVGPDYERPEMNTPATFAEGKRREFSDQAVEIKWWQTFGDQQLTALVEQSLAHNYDLKAAQANLREARALYLEVGLDLLPTITSHANYTEQKRSIGSLNNRNFVPRQLNLYNVGFDAFWEVDLFGRVRRNIEASSDEVDAQEASLRDVSISLIAEVARNYFQLRGLQLQMQVAQENVQTQSETLELTRVRAEYGRGTQLDVSRAQSQLDGTRASIPTITVAIEQAIHRLSVLSGQMPKALAEQLSPSAPLPKDPGIIAIGHPDALLRRRPDIRIAERQLAAATARIGVATADLFPRVTFVGSISLEAMTLSGLAAPGAESYSVGPKISWPALDLGRVLARLKASDAHAEASLAYYEQTVLNALEETENALVSYGEQRKRRELLTRAAEASKEAHRLALLRYQEGVSDFLTVLDSEARLRQDQALLAQSETAAATALTAVYKALGGGWETVSPEKTVLD